MRTLYNRILNVVQANVGANGNGDGRAAPLQPLAEEQPLRAELFSIEQLERHAKSLAGWHQVAPGRPAERLLPRLDENEQVLLRAYELVTGAVEHDRRIAPASEWLLDNFYMIEDQIRTARRHLPASYSRELPRLANGPRAGFPRVYDIALELIQHVDGRIDDRSLASFVQAYQSVSPLRLGELWAIPIMLRLALLENLRRVAARIAAARVDRDFADDWAEKMLDTAENSPADLILVLADMVRAKPPFSSAFVTEFTRRLQGQNPNLAFAVTWIEQRLGEQGMAVDQLVLSESHDQAQDQISIGNSIGSLRFLGATDWRDFVETHSVVEHALRADPAGVYADMTFATRDRYRHVVEQVAKRSRLTEEQVAQEGIALAKAGAAGRGLQERRAHVGFYLLGPGRRALERTTSMRPSLGQMLERIGERSPLLLYLDAILLLTIILCIIAFKAAAGHAVPAWKLGLFAIFPVMAAGQLAIALVNWLTTAFVKPSSLPRMDFNRRIPSDHRTIVAVPTMLTSVQGVTDLIEGLEIRYLANRDENLYFALLTDFRDAPTETMPDDEALLKAAREGIESLNAKYPGDRPNTFFLVHRPRRWNESEGVWMGYERKRGKLAEFNQLLRGGDRSRFSVIVGDMRVLSRVRHVITLDTDTQLPRDSARHMIGAMAHPLNRPVFDRKNRRVVSGYGILQPRVAVSLPVANRSLFVQLFAGDAGIDPYTRSVSDVYQDVFHEGSFIGKGIYDVDAFEEALAGRFRENAILSHDLLEGSYARSALLSDVQLYEEHPSRYPVDVSRRHRWIRGDWQIARWILPRIPGPDGHSIPNPISGLSRWKIIDNLRRSLTPIALVLLLLGAWAFVLGPPGLWTGFVLAVIFLPPLLMSVIDLVRKPSDLPLTIHLGSVADSAVRTFSQALLTLIFLPYEAYISLDAIVRTLWRLVVTRKKLLEWQTASDAERQAHSHLGGFYHAMWVAPALAGVAAVGVAVSGRHDTLWISMAILGLWFLSPAGAWFISRPSASRRAVLDAEQTVFLEKLARRTWRFFETFINENEHWLPPDNFQEHPRAVVASRTSPTNIGLSLLSNLAAYDFGYIPVSTLIDRTDKTLTTIDGLEKYRGHLFNWYDTRTLRPLPPLYVSTVDSGNFAGHLLTLGPGLRELANHRILPPRVFSGLRDTARVLSDAARGVNQPADAEIESRVDASPALLAKIDAVLILLDQAPTTLSSAATLLRKIASASSEIGQMTARSFIPEVAYWAGALERDARSHLEDLVYIAPWAIHSLPQENIPQDGSLHELLSGGDAALTLSDVAKLRQTLLPELQNADQARFSEFRQFISDASERAAERIATLETLAQRSHELATIDFGFLLDETRDLFAIGYNVTDHRMDNSFYDLLASEARLTSFLAVADGQAKEEHWFALGRQLTNTRHGQMLLSWSGSMFEYLMPLLVMPTYEGTLLDQTCRAAVWRQIEYGRQRGVPWGISESGYNTTDVNLNYQYRAFGVPGLGFKRGLGEDLVIAPYASVMALMVEPVEACRNLQRLAAEGRQGAYGMYEAIDYTPSRVPVGQSSATVRSFMAHHEGMSFLSLDYALVDRPMQRRFDSDPLFKATELLLQERVPKAAPIHPHAAEVTGTRRGMPDHEGTLRIFATPNTPTPEVHLLSNGNYHVLISAAGGGYSRWRDLAVTRWREDPTRDCWGQFCYLRDPQSGDFWSTAYQPTLMPGKSYESIFSQAKAEFRRRDGDIATHVEIAVSPEADIELRRVKLTNWGRAPRTIEITSYGEVVIAPAHGDLAHPAFSNLFVQTELVPEHAAILATRRARTTGENPPWMIHLMSVEGEITGKPSFETDRSKFVGRCRTLASPAAMYGADRLSDSQGSVLDPIVSIRRSIRLAPEGTATIDIITGMAETRDGAMALIEKYKDPNLAERVFGLAWTHATVVHRHLNIEEADAQTYGRLAGSVVYPTALRRAAPSVLAKNRRGQSGLWGYGISGDLPIVLLRVSDTGRIDLVKQVLQAHAYWRRKGLVVDLVIWNEDHSVYRQTLHDMIMGLIAAGAEASLVDKPGGIFVRRADQMSDEDRFLMQTVARIVITDSAGTLAEQVERRGGRETAVPRLAPLRLRRSEVPIAVEVEKPDLFFFNGLGGFTRDGREYIITTNPGEVTPAPWVNVIANEYFGTVISESGPAYTWCENSHEFRLTPWNNDPVTDTTGEAFYLRDEESGRYWSPTPLPARGGMPYTTRHGFGYSIFEYTENGIASNLIVYVAMDAPVKFCVLKVHNTSGRTRSLSATGYFEWVLGELRGKTLMHVVTEIDPRSGAVFARNPYNTEFADRVAFVDVNESIRTVTGDRTEFLGRNGSASAPAALGRTRLSGKVGAGLDPCAAVQVPFELADGQEREIIFMIGSGQNTNDAQILIQRFRGSFNARNTLQGVWDFWKRTLGVVWMETPDPAINVLGNGWLLYQVLACRLWARTGFYQSGGAFGFRDQLQDVMALLHAQPRLLRQHLLRSAEHQFKEGDVQHWWHPPKGRGVRTHFSDDYLWLPYAVCRYVLSTGDTGVLDEKVNFIEGRPVNPNEEAYYDLPQRSEAGTLYDHCVRAIKNGLKFGEHGLPLMGCGDWNDGMNLVGEKGKGESVWLAFFLVDVLAQFTAVAGHRGDSAFADLCVAKGTTLRANIEANAWDGSWYRRAYFDDGTPLGSASNAECRIDSLPQSWSVLSGAGDPDRQKMAMESVDTHLVRRGTGLIQLFDPPFDKSDLNPGYIKGYVPGVRENGGQYTHAAVWTVMAFAAMRDRKKAWELTSLINPVNHGAAANKIGTYKVEPYVIAADVYAVPPHIGRGGWTWYTGSAGWMYRLVTESLLGIKLEVDKLRLTPLVPEGWKSLKLHYRYRETFYHITVTANGPGTQVRRVTVDGNDQADFAVPMTDDRKEHRVEVEVG